LLVLKETKVLSDVFNWFLSIELAKTDNERRAASSFFIWGDRAEGGYKLTILGFVNGFLQKLNIVLVKYIDENDYGRVTGFALKKKWW
jgi:hypothetical protein